MRTDGYCPKCNSNSSFDTYKGMDGRIYCECHNPDCKYTGDSVEFMFYQPKPNRVLKDLSMKFVVTSTQRKQELKEALELRGIYLNAQQPTDFFNAVFYWLHDGQLYWHSGINRFESIIAEEFTFPDAIKLINECPIIEKIEKESKWIEFDIVDGFYHLETGGKINWQEHLVFEIAKGYIFGGWLWEYSGVEDYKKWSMRRYGVVNRYMLAACSQWDYPLVPKKIRFYKGE